MDEEESLLLQQIERLSTTNNFKILQDKLEQFNSLICKKCEEEEEKQNDSWASKYKEKW